MECSIITERISCSLNHDDFREKAFVDMVSGSDEKRTFVRYQGALGFMYAHPGSKMFAAGQDAGLEKFMSELNKFYAKMRLYMSLTMTLMVYVAWRILIRKRLLLQCRELTARVINL